MVADGVATGASGTPSLELGSSPLCFGSNAGSFQVARPVLEPHYLVSDAPRGLALQSGPEHNCTLIGELGQFLVRFGGTSGGMSR